MMKNLLFATIVVLTISSCVTNKGLQGVYNLEPKVFLTSLSFDEAWTKVIDEFATSGFSIKVIDRSSGLIVTEDYSFMNSYTIERKTVPQNGGAWIVVENRTDIYGQSKMPTNVEGSFNVRIKPTPKGSSININLTNPKASYFYDGGYIPLECATTGVFEEYMAQRILGYENLINDQNRGQPSESDTDSTSLLNESTDKVNEDYKTIMESLAIQDKAIAELRKEVTSQKQRNKQLLEENIDLKAKYTLLEEKWLQRKIIDEPKKLADVAPVSNSEEVIIQKKSGGLFPKTTTKQKETTNSILVQFFTSSFANKTFPKLSNIGQIITVPKGKLTIYQIQIADESKLDLIKKAGFKDAFIVE